MTLTIPEIAWEKMQGLIPAIIQHANTNAVLMLGYMNQQALERTLETQWVTFYSRSKNTLWVKGETSGNKLKLVNLVWDCDKDAILITVNPTGPVCHTGMVSCFGEVFATDWSFLQTLEMLIDEREQLRPANSYITKLLNAGLSRVAQKVGEEGVEVVLAAIEKNDAEFSGEVADLFFHVLVLLKARKLNMSHIIEVLKNRRGGF